MTESTQPEANEERSFFGIIVHSFFIIPFLIAVFCVLLFAGINLLTSENRTAYDYLEDVKTGGTTKRWQGAFELSKILSHPDLVPSDERFANELVAVFKHSINDDNRVRQYLALAMGRTENIVYFDALVEGLSDKQEESTAAILYSLGMLKDKRALPVLFKYLDHSSSRIRSIATVALGTIGSTDATPQLQARLYDKEPNVQWGAAISLAHMGDLTGKDVLLRLTNRNYLSDFPEVDPDEQTNLMISAINAVMNLKDEDLKLHLKEIATSDKNMKVRSAALEYVNKN